MEAWKRVRSAAKRRLSVSPRIYFPLVRSLDTVQRRVAGVRSIIPPDAVRSDRLVGPHTEIVIEGFPRSANTFVELAFRMAQDREVVVAHHLHIAAQVIEGCRREIPTVVLVREPFGAISSASNRSPEVDLDVLVQAYIAFHRALPPWRERFVLGRFEEVVQDVEPLFRAVNARFDRSFAVFRHDAANEARVFEAIEERNARRYGLGEVQEGMVARPSAARSPQQADIVSELKERGWSGLMGEAEDAYRTLTD